MVHKKQGEVLVHYSNNYIPAWWVIALHAHTLKPMCDITQLRTCREALELGRRTGSLRLLDSSNEMWICVRSEEQFIMFSLFCTMSGNFSLKCSEL